MTHGEPTPSFSDDDLALFLIEASEADTSSKNWDMIMHTIELTSAQIMRDVGYVHYDAPARVACEELRIRGEVELDLAASGLKSYETQLDQQVAYRLALLKSSEIVLLAKTQMGMLPNKDGSPDLSSTAWEQKKADIASALVVHGFSADAPIVRYMNEAIPGPLVDFESDEMRFACLSVLDTQNTHEKRQLALRQVAEEIGIDVSVLASLMQEVLSIVSPAKTDRNIYQREARIAERIRELGYDEQVAQVILQEVNRCFPLSE